MKAGIAGVTSAVKRACFANFRKTERHTFYRRLPPLRNRRRAPLVTPSPPGNLWELLKLLEKRFAIC
jgi:hypothetical protein